MTKNVYYTYAWLREDKTPYYIGKGCRGRAFDRRRKFCPPRERVLILKKNLSEEEAFKHEVYMIAVFGRKDLGTGILYNLTDGGEGASGYKHNEETKSLMSTINSGKNNPMYGRVGEKNPGYGKPRTEEIKQKISNGLTGERHPRYGKSLSNQHREKISKSRIGKKHTDETKKRMSESRSGENHNMFGKLGEKNPNYGSVRSEESRKRMSEAQKRRQQKIREMRLNGR